MRRDIRGKESNRRVEVVVEVVVDDSELKRCERKNQRRWRAQSDDGGVKKRMMTVRKQLLQPKREPLPFLAHDSWVSTITSDFINDG